MTAEIAYRPALFWTPLVCAALLSACGAKTKTLPVQPTDTAPELAASGEALPMFPSIESATDIASTNRAANGRFTLRDDAPLKYVVKKGDTLWDISRYFLKDAWQWPELWYVNGRLQNPHRIYPGDVLELAFVNGRPQLIGPDIERVVPRIRSQPLEDALPTIPIEAIRNFLRGPRVVDIDALNKAPYVLDFTDSHIVGADKNGVYIKGIQDPNAYQYSVVHRGKTYRDPISNEILGFEAIPVGELEIRQFGRTAAGVLTVSYQEVLRGDALMPPEGDDFKANFYPRPPKRVVDARIISVFNGFSQISQYQIITLSKGSNSGLEPGHVLDVMQSGRVVADPRNLGGRELLPDLYAGQVMVFKTHAKVSYALVLKADRPIHIGDKADKPQPAFLRP
jgi:hypothetical protein